MVNPARVHLATSWLAVGSALRLQSLSTALLPFSCSLAISTVMIAKTATFNRVAFRVQCSLPSLIGPALKHRSSVPYVASNGGVIVTSDDTVSESGLSANQANQVASCTAR